MTSAIVMRLAVVSVVVTAANVALAAPPSARSPEKAASDVRARELFQKGDTAYAEGRYEEALLAFQEAYDLSGRPQLLFNVSNALERLGKYQEAVEALEKYLQSGKAKDRDVVQKRLANLKRRVDEQKKADAAKEEEERKRQEEAQKTEPSRVEPPPEPKPPPDPPKENVKTPVLPFVVLGVGGAALITSGIFALLTSSARSDVDVGCKDSPAGRLCTTDASDAIDRDKTFSVVTDVALVSGLLLGGAGVYLLLTSKDDGNKNAGAVTVGMGARPMGAGGAGAALVGSF